MAVELVGGAVFGEFLSAVLKVKDNVKEFRPRMMELENTLRQLAPMIKQIQQLNAQLNRSNQSTTQSLEELMKEGKNLVGKCLHVAWWNILKKSRYHKKLVELDNSILRSHILYMQADTLIEAKISNLNLNRITNRLNYLDNLSEEELLKLEGASSWRRTRRTGIGRLTHRTSRSIRSVYRKCVRDISTAMDDAMMLNTTIEQVKDTMESLFPLLREIDSHNNEMLSGSDQSETESIRRLMEEEGKKLVRESCNIGWWNLVKKWQYQKKLAELDNKLLRFHSLHLQAFVAKESYNTTTTGDGPEKHEVGPKM